jgi:hypothetical protein
MQTGIMSFPDSQAAPASKCIQGRVTELRENKAKTMSASLNSFLIRSSQTSPAYNVHSSAVRKTLWPFFFRKAASGFAMHASS